MNNIFKTYLKFCLCVVLILTGGLWSSLNLAQTIKPKANAQQGAGLSLKSTSAITNSSNPDYLQTLDFIVAVVDNEPITNREVNNLANMANPAAAKAGNNALLLDSLENLINEATQLQIARQLNIQVSAEELQ